MSKYAEHLKFAAKLRTPDEEATKRIGEHFNAQKDLFTTCQVCKQTIKGTLEELKAHICSPS